MAGNGVNAEFNAALIMPNRHTTQVIIRYVYIQATPLQYQEELLNLLNSLLNVVEISYQPMSVLIQHRLGQVKAMK